MKRGDSQTPRGKNIGIRVYTKQHRGGTRTARESRPDRSRIVHSIEVGGLSREPEEEGENGRSQAQKKWTSRRCKKGGTKSLCTKKNTNVRGWKRGPKKKEGGGREGKPEKNEKARGSLRKTQVEGLKLQKRTLQRNSP